MGSKRAVNVFLGACGFGLLIWMINKIGFSVLKGSLSAFGLGPAFFLVAIYAPAQLFYCMAWFLVLDDPQRNLSFGRTFLAYLAGDAINMTVPSGNLAGEPVKVLLIRDRVPFETAVTSVTIYKFADFISMTLFLLAGWLIHFLFYSLPLSWNVGAGIVIGGMSLISVFLLILQKRGLYLPAGRWLQKIGPVKDWIERKLESAHLVDKEIREFFLNKPARFSLAVFFHFLAWFGGVVEIWLFMKFADVHASFPAALTIETFSLFINNVIFFVPARVGVGEGGRLLLFMALGYPAQAGLSYGIIRRIRESAWILLGVVILMLFKRGQAVRNPAVSL